MKIIISGGGFSSLYLSILLSKEHEVFAIEEHGEIGKNICCTGLVSGEVLKRFPKTPVTNRIKNVEVVAPSGKIYGIDGVREVYVIDRIAFEKILGEKSLDSGTKIILNARVVDVLQKAEKVGLVYKKDGERREIYGDMVVGADGPLSLVRKKVFSEVLKEPLIGVQAIVKRRIADDTIRIYPTKKYSDGLFAWEVPYEDYEIVGTASHTLPLTYFRKFVKDLNLEVRNFCMKIIPIGLLSRFEKDNFRLIGDAAAMCKPTSGGGIYPSAVAAEILAKNIYGGYEENFRKNLGKELQKGFIVQNIYRNVDDGEREKLLKLLEDEEIVELVRTKGDVDHPLKFGYSLLKKRPSLIKYIPKFLRNYFSL